MNRDDRAALIALGKQFTPALFEKMNDPAEVNDEMILHQIGNAFASLNAAAEDGAQLLPVEASDPQPPAADVAKWLAQQGLTVTRRVDHIESNAGRQHRRYSARQDPATMDDCLSWRLDALTGDMHLVMVDGRTYRLPYA